jgi:hypothetical protein
MRKYTETDLLHLCGGGPEETYIRVPTRGPEETYIRVPTRDPEETYIRVPTRGTEETYIRVPTKKLGPEETYIRVPTKKLSVPLLHTLLYFFYKNGESQTQMTSPGVRSTS